MAKEIYTRNMYDLNFGHLDCISKSKGRRQRFLNFFNLRNCGPSGTSLKMWDRSVKKVFSFIISYFNKKVKFNLYAAEANEFAEKNFL